MADAYNRALGGSLSGLLGMYEDWKAQPRMAAIGGLLMGDTKPLKEMMGNKPWPTQMPTGKSNMPEAQKQALTQDAINVALDWNNPMAMSGLIGHTVWHGSPHKFDKFDMSKIGTGEGAQAYGHGLYFAESPEVAATYKGNLGETRKVGQKYYSKAKEGSAAHEVYQMYAAGWTPQSVENEIARVAASESPSSSYLKAMRAAQKKMLGEATSQGNTYKVDIPDEILPRMLDWDKPLSQQAPEVQAALDAVVQRKASGNMFDPSGKFPRRSGFKEASGSDAIKMLQSAVRGDFRAEGLLQEAGIPGIRYLDGNSRGTGGTSNFVLFDDKLPRIIERNGVPTGLKPWKDEPEALRGLLGM